MAAPIVMENNSLVSVHFDSILDLMEHKPGGQNRKEFSGFMERSREGSRHSWFGRGNKNAGAVIDHALLGHKEIHLALKRLKKNFDEFIDLDKINHKQKIKKIQRKIVHGEFGDEIDIHKVYSGNIKTAWTRRVRETVDAEHSLITLFINIGGNSKKTVSQSLWGAVVALKIYDELIAAGKTVKIIAGATTRDSIQQSNKLLSISIAIKNYNQSLSVERLAAMANIAFYRVFGFSAMCAQNSGKMTYNLGVSARTNNNNVPINFQNEIKEGHTKIVYIDNSLSMEDAREDLAKVYDQLKSMSE